MADVGCIVHAFPLTSAALGIQSWYEHVGAKANVCDEGPRGDSSALGMPFIEYQIPEWPKTTAQAGPSTWFQWFSEHQNPS